MTTDQTADLTSEPDDDGWPPVRFALRNAYGRNPEIELNVHTLGLERYLLVTTGETAVQVEASHMDMSVVAETLGFLTATAMQADQVAPESRVVAYDLVAGVVSASHGRVIRDVNAERIRQVDDLGYTPEHDDAHGVGDLADLADAYISDDEPLTRDRLVKAIATLVAAVEVLDRQEA
jgi:hypothetical protein